MTSSNACSVAERDRDLELPIVRDAVTALGTMGAAAKTALPALERLRRHRDSDLRARAAVAIRQIEAGGNGSR
jgi:HEAT repeat protein